MSDKILPKIEPQLLKRQDPAIESFLNSVAKRLGEGSDAFSHSDITVTPIGDRAGVAKNYSIPGIRIYLSTSLLKGVEYENELSGWIALELARILNRDYLKGFEKDPEVKAADAIKLFDFTFEQTLSTIEPAVGILYSAGYDPRGLVSNWEKLKRNLKISPYTQKELNELIEVTYRAISIYAPLRNPTLRSEAFWQFHKKVQKL